MIAFANNNQKQDVMHIWQESFPDDSSQFIEMYFREKYRSENTLLYFVENKPMSCLQMLPYEMTFYNTICKTSYISGAATLPEYKNQGIMGKLLTASFSEMRKRGDNFTMLIPQEPWLIDFYQKYGYTPCFEYCLNPVSVHMKIDNQQYTIVEMNNTNKQIAFRFYSEYCKEQNLFVLKSYEDFLVIWEDLQLADGTIFLCLQSEEVCGICFCFPSKEKIIVKDLIVDSENTEKQLIHAVAEKYPNKEVFIFKQANDNFSSTLGMARILNVDHVLEAYANYYPLLEITLKVTDNQIAKNNGFFQMKEGKCIRTKDDNYDLSVDTSLLTQLVMGYQTYKLPLPHSTFPLQHSYMSLMLD